jgi:phosphopentomutase
LESFDGVLGGLIEASRGGSNLIVLTSDHGNLEDSGRRGHTRNPVPALLIGPSESRGEFARDLKDLTGFHSAVVRAIFGEGATAGAAPT